MVQEWRRGDIDQVDVRPLQQGIDLLDVGNPEAFRRSLRSLPVRACHSGEPDAGHLCEVLKREESEAATADDAESDRLFVHRPVE